MYFLVYFDITRTNQNLRYPLPQSIDLAVLDETHDVKLISSYVLPDIQNNSDMALIQSWKVGMESVVAALAEYERRFLIFPTQDHLTLFHIIKQKCKLRTKSTANGALAQLKIWDETCGDYTNPVDFSIEKMVSIVKSVGPLPLSENPAIFAVPSKESAAKEGIEACESFSYIADTRTGVYHTKYSACLQSVPAKHMRGLGKKPPEGYTACTKCKKQIQNIKNEDTKLKRLIYGGHAGDKKIIGRCYSRNHPGYLTKKLVEIHKCIEKNCTAFMKLRPEYWNEIERIEQKKKDNRLNRKKEEKSANDRDKLIRETLEKSGHIYITSIREERASLLVVSYIYDKQVDLSSEIKYLRSKLMRIIKLQARIGTDDAIEQLIRKPRRETKKVTDLLKAPTVGPVAKSRLNALGVFCLEDLFGRCGDELYQLDCELSGGSISRRFLTTYRNAVNYANEI